MSLFLLARRPSRSLYDSVSEGSASVVIRQYSSSFGLASRLLAEPVRTQVRNVYALVRVADEIVDNPDPDLGPEPRETMLTWLHDDVRHALRTGYSGNLVVHAFARTAIRCGITEELVDPFFASMRMDLATTVHTAESVDRYIYGSAEVVGLMCLRVFLAGEAADGRVDATALSRGRDYDRLAPGARRLGAAFQKLNFLRDLAEDHDALGRCYFPELDVERFCDADRDRILDDVAADLDAAADVVPELPTSSRRAVRVAHATFSELAARLRSTPAAEIRRTRIRVPTAVKLRLVAGALSGGRS
jgi:15-cis-phytoene synthase